MIVAICNKVLYNETRLKAYKYSSQFQWDEVGVEFGKFIEGLKQ
jgi:hypothetical protein